MPEKASVSHGLFGWGGQEVWGELRFAGRDTALTLRSEAAMQSSAIPAAIPKVIHGRMHDFSLVTCVDCVGTDEPQVDFDMKGSSVATWRIFPHFVATGRSHFDPATDRIETVWFSVSDIYQIFDDFDSFGFFTQTDAKQKIKELVPTKIGERDTPLGDQPVFSYFAGRRELLKTQLPVGEFKVVLFPATSFSSEGASIKNNMRIQLAFTPAIGFSECSGTVRQIGQFLSLIAGRSQGIDDVTLKVEGEDSGDTLTLHWPLSPKPVKESLQDTPWWLDMPLDGIRNSEEFSQVLQNWFSSDAHKDARARLYACRNLGNHYTVDRLVAAANLFELTQQEELPEISDELKQACDACLNLLEATEKSDDRDSAIAAIKRVGKPTMMKKILHRASLLNGHFHLPHLQAVIRQAVLCRNYYVHGSDDKRYKHHIVKPHIALLTETLEFVFAAGELIECGWMAAQWRQRPHTAHHWFSRFSSYFAENSQRLVAELDAAKVPLNAVKTLSAVK